MNELFVEVENGCGFLKGYGLVEDSREKNDVNTCIPSLKDLSIASSQNHGLVVDPGRKDNEIELYINVNGMKLWEKNLIDNKIS